MSKVYDNEIKKLTRKGDLENANLLLEEKKKWEEKNEVGGKTTSLKQEKKVDMSNISEILPDKTFIYTRSGTVFSTIVKFEKSGRITGVPGDWFAKNGAKYKIHKNKLIQLNIANEPHSEFMISVVDNIIKFKCTAGDISFTELK
jgi:hypothetical protein